MQNANAMNAERRNMTEVVEIREDTIISGIERLHRIIVEPGSPWAQLLLLHGYGDHAGRYLEFLQWMGSRGVAGQAIDFRGQGRSTGRRGFVRKWEEYLDDLQVMLGVQDRSIPLFVLGHSHGALVAAAAGIEKRMNCRGCILTSPYLQLRMTLSWRQEVLAAIGSCLLPALRARSGVGVEMLTRDAEIAARTRADPLCQGTATPRWFVTARRMQAFVRAHAADFTDPLLMLVAGEDSIADPSASVHFFEGAGSADKTLRSYQDHRHELLLEIGREMIFEEILKWMEERA
jgi:lysophospholipase